MGSESDHVALGHDALFPEAHEVKDPVERLLLPLEAVGVALRELLVGQRRPPAPEAEGQDRFAQGGDGVLEGRVVGGSVAVRHRRRLLLPLLATSLTECRSCIRVQWLFLERGEEI